jgi:penicillin amidase
MDQWNWGKLHTVTMTHSLGRSKVLASLFSIGPFPSSGDGVTINIGFYRHSNPYRQIVGPSLRMILDLGDLRRSRFVLSSGQSGHPFSRHYADQLELWRRGNYIYLYEFDGCN